MKKNPKISVLINPKSGHGKGVRVCKTINRARKSDNQINSHLKYVEFTSPDDNSDTLKRMAKDSDVILICGGDGTVHRIVNTMVCHGIDVALSIYPMGTGNDLSRCIGTYRFKRDVILLIKKLIESPEHMKLDVFSVNDRVFFTNYVSFGYDAHIISAYESLVNSLKNFKIFEFNFLKKFLFICIGLYAAFFYRKKLYEPAVKDSFSSVIVNNLRTYAGGSVFNRVSSLHDGVLETAYINSKMEYLKIILNRFRMFNLDIHSESQEPPLRLRFGGGLCVQVDGEDYTGIFNRTQEFVFMLKCSIIVCV